MRIKLNGQIHVLSDSWADVPMKHREALFTLLLLFEEKDAKIVALQQMLKLSKGIFLRIAHKDIAALIAQLTWFNLQPSATPILPFFEEKGTRYYFPKADFLNGTALEFMLIQELYNDFVKSDFDLNILRSIAAVMLRESDKKTQNRVLLTENDEAHEKRQQVFKSLSPTRCTLVLRYVQGVLDAIERTGTTFGIFGPPKEGEADTPNINIFGWKSVFRSIAETGPFGDYDAVLQRPFWDIIEILAEREALREAQKTIIENHDAIGNQDVSD